VRSNQSATLTWQTSGKVAVINGVKDQVVTANTILASLDQSSLSPNLILAQAQLANDKKALDDLMIPKPRRLRRWQALDSAQQALDDYTTNFQLTQAQAQIALANATDALTTAQNKRADLNTVHGSQAQIDTAKRMSCR